jgi:hypothetical protein
MGFDPISSLLDVGKALIDKLIPDPKAKAEATQKLLEMQQAGDLAVIAGQLKVNEIEAASPVTFVSGWRPAVGWVCALALAFQLVIEPMISWIAQMAGHPIPILVLDTQLLTTLLVGMLGLGGMRTVEKLQNVASK